MGDLALLVFIEVALGSPGGVVPARGQGLHRFAGASGPDDVDHRHPQ
jgi:hypothetical protein